ncbi:hypothetical protein EMCRGX_G032323 [Ephydatia muelleri]
MALEEGKTYLPGTASLLQEIDKKLLVVLRDGKTLIGFLRSVDQFANLLLQGTVERIYVGKEYGDIPRGVYLVRGENVSLYGELDSDLEAKQLLTEVSVEDILEAQRLQQAKVDAVKKKKDRLLSKKGLRQADNADDFFS